MSNRKGKLDAIQFNKQAVKDPVDCWVWFLQHMKMGNLMSDLAKKSQEYHDAMDHCDQEDYDASHHGNQYPWSLLEDDDWFEIDPAKK